MAEGCISDSRWTTPPETPCAPLQDAWLPASLRQAFARQLARAVHAPAGTRDVDLLVRTGGEQRLSDFMLWECAYAELVFTDVSWPDFGPADLVAAVETFHTRERRFGGLAYGPAHREPRTSRQPRKTVP